MFYQYFSLFSVHTSSNSHIPFDFIFLHRFDRIEKKMSDFLPSYLSRILDINGNKVKDGDGDCFSYPSTISGKNGYQN